MGAGNAIQAFGNGTDVGVWQPQPPIRATVADALTGPNQADPDGDPADRICRTFQVEIV